jgi:hypothetical protein
MIIVMNGISYDGFKDEIIDAKEGGDLDVRMRNLQNNVCHSIVSYRHSVMIVMMNGIVNCVEVRNRMIFTEVSNT